MLFTLGVSDVEFLNNCTTRVKYRAAIPQPLIITFTNWSCGVCNISLRQFCRTKITQHLQNGTRILFLRVYWTIKSEKSAICTSKTLAFLMTTRGHELNKVIKWWKWVNGNVDNTKSSISKYLNRGFFMKGILVPKGGFPCRKSPFW